LDNACPQIYTKNWNMMEFLMTAPELPVNAITPDGRPIYAEHPAKWEEKRKDVYPSVSAGALEFADDANRIFGGDIFLQNASVIKFVNNFCDNPTRRDMREMSIIRHAYDGAHQRYIPLFSVRIPFWDFALHPRRSMALIKSAPWRSAPQTIAVMMARPVKIKMRRLKCLQIILFPKLRRRYFTLLFLSDRCGIIIGNQDE
jgi:predicted HAD superfamily hydrolase